MTGQPRHRTPLERLLLAVKQDGDSLEALHRALAVSPLLVPLTVDAAGHTSCQRIDRHGLPYAIAFTSTQQRRCWTGSLLTCRIRTGAQVAGLCPDAYGLLVNPQGDVELPVPAGVLSRMRGAQLRSAAES